MSFFLLHRTHLLYDEEYHCYLTEKDSESPEEGQQSQGLVPAAQVEKEDDGCREEDQAVDPIDEDPGHHPAPAPRRGRVLYEALYTWRPSIVSCGFCQQVVTPRSIGFDPKFIL